MGWVSDNASVVCVDSCIFASVGPGAFVWLHVEVRSATPLCESYCMDHSRNAADAAGHYHLLCTGFDLWYTHINAV